MRTVLVVLSVGVTLTGGALFVKLAGNGAGAPPPPDLSLTEIVERLRPLHREPPTPRPDDWRLGPGADEPGQSFNQWRRSRPVTAHGERNVLYLKVIGELDPAQAEIVALAETFLALYFGLDVKRVEPAVIDDEWPYYAKRNDQLLSTYVLQHVLEPELPGDAAAMIGFTAWDLWPGHGWNFVFGQASLINRVGVWSIHRFGDPEQGDAERRQCLRRTLRVASHETGHMFSIRHCIAYACNMCGSNNLDEADRTPLAMCPECLPKLCEATGVEPVERFERLEAFCREHGLDSEADFYRRCLAALGRVERD